MLGLVGWIWITFNDKNLEENVMSIVETCNNPELWAGDSRCSYCTRVWHPFTFQCIRSIVSQGWGVYGFSLTQVYDSFFRHYTKAIDLPQTVFSRTFSSFLVTSGSCSIIVSQCTCNLSCKTQTHILTSLNLPLERFRKGISYSSACCDKTPYRSSLREEDVLWLTVLA